MSATLDSLFQTAQQQLAAGQLDAAAATCEAMLAQKKNSFNALMLRGDIARAAGDPHGELDWVKRAVMAEPKHARARAHLASRYNALGDPKRALTHAEKAVRLDGALPAARLALAIAYEGLDKRDRAQRAIAPLLDGAALPEAAAIQMRLFIHDGDLDAAVALGERVRDAAPEPGVPLRNVLLSLAAAYDKADRLDDAFATACAGNAVAAPPFDPDALDAMIDATIAFFSRERFAALPRATEASELPVFLVGVPRVGSTLTDRIIHAHPSAFGAGEIGTVHSVLGPLAAFWPSAQPYPACLVDATPDALDAFQAAYVAHLRTFDRRAVRVTNKELFNAQHLGLIACALPGARIIHCTRDPLDLGLSCFLERLPTTSCPWSCDLEHIGRMIRATERLMAHWRDALGIPMLEVAYEDLVAEQEATSRRIIEFLALPWDDACLAFHAVKRAETTLSYQQVRQPMYAKSVDRAERYAPHLAPLRAALDGA